jgi:hypothetical protein
MATKKEKKQLIDKIKYGNKKYKFSIGRYGGETVMGTITREQYEYWKDRDDELQEYVMGFDREEYEREHNIPDEAKFSGDWYEQDNVEHICGGEVSDGNYLQIDEFDQDGNPIKNADGTFKMWEPIALGIESRDKHGIKTNDYQQFDEDHNAVNNKCYFYGQMFNKGGWHNEELVELGEELDTNKITLNCSEVQGWLLCNSISYEGLSEDIHLSEDSTGSSQTCCVREGGQNPDTMAAEEDADEPPAPSPEEQMRWMAEMMKKEAKEKSKKKKVKAKKTVKGKKQTKKKKEKK